MKFKVPSFDVCASIVLLVLSICAVIATILMIVAVAWRVSSDNNDSMTSCSCGCQSSIVVESYEEAPRKE